MAKKYIVTQLNTNASTPYIFYGIHDGRQFEELHVCAGEEESVLGNIYIGKVRDVVPSIQAAFVEFQPGRMGYYSLEDNTAHFFLNRKNTEAVRPGDELIVQVSKDALKTKDAVLTSKINISGRYVAITRNKTGIGLSSKITDEVCRESLRETLAPFCSDEYGIVVRTNAGNVDHPKVAAELASLLERWENIYKRALSRTPFTVLYQKQPMYLERMRGLYQNEIDEFVTDIPDVYEEWVNNSDSHVPEKLCRLYQDELLSLAKLYSVPDTIAQLLKKKVWLKCGGYLVIEPTEAMVVIDVNSGKFSKGKNLEQTIYKVNLEAATEIARQIRLRNLSGILLIDFINMHEKENERMVIQEFQRQIARDPVKTTVVDMTKLQLLEVTRKKELPPLHEVVRTFEEPV